MSLSLAILLTFVCLCAATRTELQYKTEFAKFMVNFDKDYKTLEEREYRYQIFKEKLDLIESHNGNAKKQFSMGINQFSDLTNEEFHDFLGFKPEYKKNGFGNPARNNFQLPKSVDWRNQNAVTDIKDQGACGSCWAFSTTGTIEGFHAIQTKKLVSLSEQNIIDCTWGEPYNNTGCEGGDMRTALQYVINNKGIDTEDSYPYADYEGEDGEENCTYSVKNIGAVIHAVHDVISGNETDLAYAVFNCPVSVAIDASLDSFQNYEGGIYYEPECESDLQDLDHGVLVVGYGVEDDDEYWIVKNSWGPTWGMEGYILMSRGDDNQCGIATYATFPTA